MAAPKYGRGPIEPPDPESVKQTPFNLPGAFVWSELDLDVEEEAKELYTLLHEVPPSALVLVLLGPAWSCLRLLAAEVARCRVACLSHAFAAAASAVENSAAAARRRRRRHRR